MFIQKTPTTPFKRHLRSEGGHVRQSYKNKNKAHRGPDEEMLYNYPNNVAAGCVWKSSTLVLTYSGSTRELWISWMQSQQEFHRTSVVAFACGFQTH